MNKEIEERLVQLSKTDFGEKYNLKVNLSDIEEIPINDFDEIKNMLFSGKAILRIHPASIDGTTFNILSTTFQGYRSLFYTAIMFLGPVVSLVLSFLYSWFWLALLVIAPFVGFRLGRGLYIKVLCQKASESETIFSYLFCAWKITIELPGYGVLTRE